MSRTNLFGWSGKGRAGSVALLGLMVVLFLGAAGFSEAALRVEGTQSDAERAEVLAELRQYYADFSARDWEAFASHFWKGATITTVWQPPGEAAERVVVTSVPDFVAQAPAGPGSKPIFEETMRDAQVRVFQNLAHVWARYDARFGDPGNVMEWSGIDAFTLMKHDGSWKIVALAFSAEH